MSKLRRIARHLLLLGMFALPLILLVSSALTFHEFNEMRGLYLRNRAATIAARLETLSPEQLSAGLADQLAPEEPALEEVTVFEQDDRAPEDPILASIRDGKELFHTEQIRVDGVDVFRAYIPFHSHGKLLIARIDLDPMAADFLLIHARHNLVVAWFSGFALVVLSFYVVWSLRRAALMERRQLELEHLAQLGKMSAILAHEIRNPLGTVKGFTQLAREKASDAVAALLDPALDEIRRLESLVRHLLLYGRPPEPAPREIEWKEIAGQLEAHARETIGSRPIRFVSTSDPWRFRTDPDLLQQALLNLIRNSIEALGETPEGEVRLSAARNSRGVFAIAVEDNGPGIPESVRRKMFQPFVTTKSLGTGLGLSISRKLVETLGGVLELRPREPRGTLAEIRFPKLEVEHGTEEINPAWKQS